MQQSHLLFQRAQVVIPGGVNSPVRAFKAVGGEPFFVKRGQGAYLYDEDGNHYIDYVGSWGPLILGHSHPKVIEAIIFAAKEGLSFGIPNRREIELAEQINYLMPSMEKIRMVSSGTEATMTALRLARGYTGRNKIIKFEGCYHGHNDSLLVKAGSGLLTLGLPSSAGIAPEVVRDTLVANYNDLTQVEMLFRTHHPHIAAVIVEPVAGNMNCIPPVPGFLEGLRNLCDQYGAVLIFDEVITGFRVALGGAQGLFNIKPDLTTLGKIIGGGLPVGALGGQRDIMDYLAPVGPVYQAGTLSGNPVAMAAGLATLEQLLQPEFYESLSIKTTRLLEGITKRAQAAKIPLITQQVGSLFGLLFTELPQVTSYHQVIQTNTSHFTNFFHGMLNNNVYLAPSPFEVGFMSAAHEEHEIEASLLAVENVFSKL